MVKMSECAPNKDSQQQQLSPTMSTTTDSSDFSVISHPSQSSDAAAVNGSMSSYFQDLHFALNSAVPDMSFDQLQTSFQDLLRENLQLKDDVLQSNVAMKEQFELMVRLQMHVERIQKEQVEKHERARVVIEGLRAENAALRHQIALRPDSTLNETKVSDLHSDFVNLKSKYDHEVEDNEEKSIVNHQLNEEMDILRSDFTNLKTAYASLLNEKKELMAMNAELQARQSIRQPSPDEFYDASDGSAANSGQGFLIIQSKKGEDDEEDGTSNQDLTLVEEKTIKNLLSQLNCEQTRNRELRDELAIEKTKVMSLKSQVEGQEEVIRRLSHGDPVVKQHGAHLMAELRVSEEKFSMANSYLQKYRDRCDSLENMLGVYQDRLQNMYAKDDSVIIRLQAEIANLRTMLVEEQAKSTDEKKNMLEAQQRFEALLKDHQNMEQELGNFVREQASKGRQSEAYYNLQEKFYRENLDSLTAKLVTLEDALAAKIEELAAVQPEIQKLKQEAETIPILQTQVELYKTDFRAERDALEKVTDEKERVSEELRALQFQHKDLLEMLAQLQSAGVQIPSFGRGHSRRHSGRGFWWGRSQHSPNTNPTVQPEHAASNSPSSTIPIRDIAQLSGDLAATSYSGSTAASPTEETPEYTCPKCSIKFSTYDPLEKHVNACLDNTDPFVMY